MASRRAPKDDSAALVPEPNGPHAFLSFNYDDLDHREEVLRFVNHVSRTVVLEKRYEGVDVAGSSMAPPIIARRIALALSKQPTLENPSGARALAFFRRRCSERTCELVFDQHIANMRADVHAALLEGRRGKALVMLLRGYVDLLSAMLDMITDYLAKKMAAIGRLIG
jgi:hypothetical protein